MDNMKIIKSGSQASIVGPKGWFTGQVRIDSPFSGTGAATIGGATVTFAPGARTNWHTHPLGQTLIITQGRGWLQEEGEEIREMNVGDIVWIPEGIKHWHGASVDTAMTHIAIVESIDGVNSTWLEPVTEEQYKK